MEIDTPTTDHAAYARYLEGRSGLGSLYRRYWLYPRLSGEISGQALDIGCGIGDFLQFRPGTIGVDINPETVAMCREQRLDARVMRVDELPFGDRAFDTAIIDNVLEHIVEPAPLLAEIARVLRPGGRVIVGVPGRKGYASDPDHKRFYNRAALVDRMERAGFATVRLIHAPLHFAGFDRWLRQYCLYGVFSRSG